MLFLDDHPHFLRYATDLATVLRNTIFVDQVDFLIELRSSFIDSLRNRLSIPSLRSKKFYNY